MNSHDPRRSPPILTGLLLALAIAACEGKIGEARVNPAAPARRERLERDAGRLGRHVRNGRLRRWNGDRRRTRHHRARGCGERRPARHEASHLPRIRSHDDPAARRHDVARVRAPTAGRPTSRLTLGSFRRTASPAITSSNTTRRRRRSSTGRSRPWPPGRRPASSCCPRDARRRPRRRRRRARRSSSRPSDCRRTAGRLPPTSRRT